MGKTILKVGVFDFRSNDSERWWEYETAGTELEMDVLGFFNTGRTNGGDLFDDVVLRDIQKLGCNILRKNGSLQKNTGLLMKVENNKKSGVTTVHFIVHKNVVDIEYLRSHYTFDEIITLKYKEDGVTCPEFENQVAEVEIH